jgi:hypothetical protein
VREQEAAVGAPGIHAKTALSAHSRQVSAIENLEDEAKALLELRLPLFEHRGRRRDDNSLRLLAQEQLARDEAGFDRLPQTSVIGDEEVDAGQTQRLSQRLHLIGVDLDAGSEWRLEKVRISGRDAIPPQRMEEGRELPGRIKPLGRQVLPAFFLEDLPVEFVFPEHLQGLALRIVVRASQSHDG